jgi:hypothetical protein
MLTGIFEIDAWGDSLGVGATAPRYCTLGGVAKLGPAGASAYIVASEYICARLGLLLGLPVPPGIAIRTKDGQMGYISLRFGPKGERPPPVIVEHLVEDRPEVSATTVAFDSWIANDDRHDQNIAYVRGKLPVVVFDHSHALVGKGPAWLKQNVEAVVLSKLLPDRLRSASHLEQSCLRISQIPEFQVRHICDSAAGDGMVTADEANLVADFLLARKRKVLDLLRQGHKEGRLPVLVGW